MFAKIKIGIAKFLVLHMGFLSHGMQLSMEEGLTSGKTLDYIYQNRASGHLLIGDIMDRAYLSHPGWEAVRIRRCHLEGLLTKAIHESVDTPYIVDIASGPGSYILSVLQYHRGVAYCQDLETRWVEEGQQKAHELGLCSRVTFAKGDAFSLDSIPKRPSIVVSSGFYDWIQEDELVKGSLKQVFNLLDDGGTFLLTIQCAHPNQKMVEEIFPSFTHAKLEMKMRSPQEVAGWLREAGFSIDRSLKDGRGYYCVIKCKKGGSYANRTL